jgi:23S rRNA (guanosine2251-2'-O)-methyltransferase
MLRMRLLAHNVRSLWNVGSFFRTADACGVERIYLTGYTGCPPRKEISKTAIGAEEFVEWEHHKDPVPLIRTLKKKGWQIIALEQTKDAIPLFSFHPSSQPQLLIVGHELDGIPDPLLSLADSIVEIPMCGKKESLNVAVATGIALFAIMRISDHAN